MTNDQIKMLRQGHIELWTWLAENPKKEKHEWPGWKSNGGSYSHVENDCFACTSLGVHDCSDENPCPVKWADTICWYPGSEYTSWLEATEEAKAELAKVIANLWPE